MIKASKCNKPRALFLVRVSIPRTFIRNATSAVPTTIKLNDLASLPPITKSLPTNLPFLMPDTLQSLLRFDSEKEKQPSTDKSNDKDKPSRKEKGKDKEKENEEKKDINMDEKYEINEETDTKPTIDPNNPVSSKSNISSSSGGDNNNNNNNNNNNDDSDGKNDDGSPKDKEFLSPSDSGLHPPFLAIAMKDRPFLPGATRHLHVSDPEVIKCVNHMINSNIKSPYFVLFHVRDTNSEDAALDVIKDRDFVHEVGTLCQIIKTTGSEILVYPHYRVKLVDISTPNSRSESIEKEQDNSQTSYLKKFEVSYAVTQQLKDEPYDEQSITINAWTRRIKELYEKLAPKYDQPENKEEIMSNPSMLADFIASKVHAKPEQIQEILESSNVETKLELSLQLLQVEADADEMRQTALKNIRERTEKAYAQSLIKEYTKELLKAAGIGENSKVHKFDERIKHLKMPEEAMKAYKTEKERLGTQSDMEQNVVERYLDWLTQIPFGVYTKDSFNVKKAREILDRDHYGLKDVKDRILEFISVGKISGNVDGKILCLAGPPGTGKTSIAKSIAEALNRKYTRIAVGGVQDVHDVKGHRRTYVASIPGRIVTALTQAKTSNPLMLIDEIDKLDTTSHGGAARAFLEILDPEQNNSFVDNFIEVKVDLSKVLFVCTANYLGSIPGPLRDRMEIIEVNGYTKNDKIEITKRHLIPAAAKKVGLDEGRVVIPDETISRLIDKYCRESGLRHIKSLINRIFSKASRKIVEELEETDVDSHNKDTVEGTLVAKESEKVISDKAKIDTENSPIEYIQSNTEVKAETTTESQQEKEKEKEKDEEIKKLDLPADLKIEVKPETLKDFVGPEIYIKDRLYETLNPGVATGLAYNTSGDGDALYIESILTDSISSDLGNAGLHVTGSLKDVMKESASIAYSFAKQFMVRQFPDNRFFEAAHIHVHCPGGAIPKDGPSAGIAFTSSLVSLALNKSLPNDTAMTGEITLTGKVLAIGGLREKSLGAKRAGYTKIIFPKDCEYQLDEIPDEVKEGLTYIPVEWYSEVFEHLFQGISKEEGNSVWKEEFAKLEDKKKSKKTNTK
ncbi:ATP-dependent protease La [Candida albicans P78048]|uniref:Lon protease homolog, mitochondrial n=1 Tax=Candida albicans P78048 TaxID=1094989 RepID=A0AB34PJK6_CANAX|nr:ATP-dependent protease La [Candida albicans P78048]